MTLDIVQIIVSVLLSVCVLVGISMMSKVKTAVAGNLLSALAMLCGVVATLFFSHILTAWTVFVAIIIGALVGSFMASRAQMIQMPQMVALFNGLGGGASALVGVMTYMGWGTVDAPEYPHFINFTAVLAIAVGMITLVGSLVAAGKLARIIDGRPKVYPAHSAVTLCLIVVSVVLILLGTVYAENVWIAVPYCSPVASATCSPSVSAVPTCLLLSRCSTLCQALPAPLLVWPLATFSSSLSEA